MALARGLSLLQFTVLVQGKDSQSGVENTLQGREIQNKFRKKKIGSSQCGEGVEEVE